MIAAIYARKSTEQHVVDEQKSVARQVAHAREFAARHRWVVDEAHVYEDDGISGAEFAKRPAFSRMMAALSRRGAPSRCSSCRNCRDSGASSSKRGTR